MNETQQVIELIKQAMKANRIGERRLAIEFIDKAIDLVKKML